MNKTALKRRVLKIIIIALLLNFVGLCVVTKMVHDVAFPRYDSLEVTWLEGQEFTFPSGQNNLWGCLYSGKKDTLIVLAPGYRASEENYVHVIEALTGYGWAVFAFDPTGCCRSEGESAVGFNQETLDLNAALDFIEAQDRFGYEEIVLFGHSRGGTAVCGALDREVSAAIAVAAMGSDMKAVMMPVKSRIGALAYSNYLPVWLYQKVLFGKYGGVSGAAQINKSTTPLLIVQGSEDTIATPEGTSLYADREHIDSEFVDFYLCDTPGQNGHSDLMRGKNGTVNDILFAQIHQFIEQHTGE